MTEESTHEPAVQADVEQTEAEMATENEPDLDEATARSFEADGFDEASVEEEATASGAALSTGHPAVDEVLRSLDELDSLPVDEHVAVFEQAHDRLRRTLSSAADDQD